MSIPFRKVQVQNEKVIDYQYIRNLKNKEVRKSRFKRTLSQRLLRLLLLTVLLGEVVYLGYHGFRVGTSSQFFFLNRIEISGTHKTDAEEIRKSILASHHNALLADLTHIKLQLENQPWIQSVVIWRELPGTIRIHITERTPVALILSDQLYLVDSSGRIIDTYDKVGEQASFPVITGIMDPSNDGVVRGALEYVQALAEDPSVLATVSEIHLMPNGNSTVYLKGFSFGLLVSKDGILPMIKKFLTYSDPVKRNFDGIKIIDLRYQDQIILKDLYREQL